MGIPLTRRAMLQQNAGLLAAGTAYPLVSACGAEPQRRAVYLPSLYDRAKLAIHCLVEHCDKVARLSAVFLHADERPSAHGVSRRSGRTATAKGGASTHCRSCVT